MKNENQALSENFVFNHSHLDRGLLTINYKSVYRFREISDRLHSNYNYKSNDPIPKTLSIKYYLIWLILIKIFQLYLLLITLLSLPITKSFLRMKK